MNPDFCDMLSALSDEGAEYLIVGAYALAAHGMPRATGDIDIWVRSTRENAAKVMRALVVFGAPLDQIQESDLATPGTVFQIGIAPRRVDILTSIEGVEFQDAWPRRLEVDLDGLVVPVLGRSDFVTNKQTLGRKKDLADLAWLDGEGD